MNGRRTYHQMLALTLLLSSTVAPVAHTPAPRTRNQAKAARRKAKRGKR